MQRKIYKTAKQQISFILALEDKDEDEEITEEEKIANRYENP